ncbi:hypothetical protein [Streptomyces antnestii]|uniref:hypothetical protein n=1 Tax=Streptomyces antnestii TaxID=2494256 RepID=UPI00167864E1|nr:hypothetical protein [Streptomyces sp. San01]
MDSEEILALYDWDTGVCFRHPGENPDTTAVKSLQPASAPAEEIRACRNCVLAMEAARRAAAEGAGIPYVPGRAGDAL